jgi:hypothetical protein
LVDDSISGGDERQGGAKDLISAPDARQPQRQVQASRSTAERDRRQTDAFLKVVLKRGDVRADSGEPVRGKRPMTISLFGPAHVEQ